MKRTPPADQPPGVWITRAEPGASASGGRVRALGLSPLIAPLLRFHPLSVEVAPEPGEALAFTSANGVSAMAAVNDLRHLPVFAVGDATAAAARGAGYADVRSAGGDISALARLIAKAAPEAGVLHPAATETAGDLVGALEALGVKARTVAVYETLVPDALPSPVAEALNAGRLSATLIHSPKAARTAAALLARAGRTVDGVHAVCLSPACAAPLEGAGFGAIAVAAEPTEAALMDCLVHAFPGRRG